MVIDDWITKVRTRSDPKLIGRYSPYRLSRYRYAVTLEGSVIKRAIARGKRASTKVKRQCGAAYSLYGLTRATHKEARNARLLHSGTGETVYYDDTAPRIVAQLQAIWEVDLSGAAMR